MDPDTIFRQGSLVGAWGEKARLLEFGKESGTGAEVEDVVSETVVSLGTVAPHRASKAVVTILVEDAIA